MVLVILIALWAMVLLPPYLKDRRSSSRTFRSMSMGMSAGGASAQRFLPLQHASTSYATSAVSSPTGMRTSGVRTGGIPSHGAGSNVVPLRPSQFDPAASGQSGSATPSGSAYFDEGPRHDERALHQAWEPQRAIGLGMPGSTAAARERRRQVLLGLTALAFVTLLLALFVGGLMTALHVLVDTAMLGYVILLVRHRQLEAERRLKLQPIRPPVTEQTPMHMQVAPSYLLQSGTGS